MHGIAVNEAGELIQAQSAESGKIYNCMTCGCQMYKTCRKGTHYFARMPGHEHTSMVCDQVEKTNTVRNAGLTTRDRFHAWLMTKPRTGTGGGGGGGGHGGPDGPEGGDGGPLIRELPYKSLKDLYTNSLHNLSENIAIGDGMLTDLFISSKTSGCVMMDNKALGPRALQVKIDGHFDERNAIRFVLCCKENAHKKVFEIIFKDNKEYKSWVKKLFDSYTDENDLTQTDVGYKFVFIHGDWVDMPIDACNTICDKTCVAGWTCTGYQYSHYVGTRQIFCPSDQLVKHK